MKTMTFIRALAPVYAVVLLTLTLFAALGSKAVTVMGENAAADTRRCVIIDAGHGGEDGGAVADNGVYESKINLNIALKLQDLLHLLGIKTKMIRTTDISVYTKGNTIAARKASDLVERARIVNETANGLLISIHQNHFSESKYSGAQVFYAKTEGSKELATQVQTTLVNSLNPGSKRQCKAADGIYLMQHIANTGILVECGFLSNPIESANLQNDIYQQKICCVLASVCSRYINNTDFT